MMELVLLDALNIQRCSHLMRMSLICQGEQVQTHPQGQLHKVNASGLEQESTLGPKLTEGKVDQCRSLNIFLTCV